MTWSALAITGKTVVCCFLSPLIVFWVVFLKSPPPADGALSNRLGTYASILDLLAESAVPMFAPW